MSSRSRAFVAILIASVLWGTAGVAAKTLVHDVNPFVASFYRFLIASILILPFFLREHKPRLVWQDLLPLSILGAMNVPLFYLGIKTTTANSATLIYTATPLATALFSSLLIQEIHSRRKLLGIFIGLVGAVFIILLPVIEKGSIVTGDLTGNLIIVGAMLSWTLYTVGSRHIHTHDTYSPLTVTSIYFFTTTLLSLLLSILTKQQFFPSALFSPMYVFTLFYSGIFITLITYFLFQWAIKRISVTTASLKQYIEPIVGVSLNTMLLGEKISTGFIIGSFLVVLGVTIATGSKILSAMKKKFFVNS